MRWPCWTPIAALVFCVSCGPTVDLSKGLKIDVVQTGWLDAGIVNGQNKLVPSAVVKLTNVSDQKLVTLQVNALFRRTGDKEEWGSAFLTAAGSDGLPPGATTGPLLLKSQNGYTGTDPRLDMLHNSQFVDAKMQLFAKYASTQWKPVGEYNIVRELREK